MKTTQKGSCCPKRSTCSDNEASHSHSSRIANAGLWCSSRAIAKRCFSPSDSSASQSTASSRAPLRSTRYLLWFSCVLNHRINRAHNKNAGDLSVDKRNVAKDIL